MTEPEKPKSGGWGNYIALAVGLTAAAYWRIVPADTPLSEGMAMAVGGVGIGLIYFGVIHLLLMQWDKWRAR